LPFQNGIVYDFGEMRPREMRPHFITMKKIPHYYEEWKAPAAVQVRFRMCMDALYKWEQDGNLDLLPEPATGDVQRGLTRKAGNPKLAEELASALRAIPGVGFFLNCFDIDCAIYYLKWWARILSAHPRFTECLFVHGPPRSGKDALAGMFEQYLGGEDGYVSGLPQRFIMQEESRTRSFAQAKEACQPFLAGLQGSRVAIIPELPDGIIDFNMLKPLTEQEGAKITTRGCSTGSKRFSPTWAFVAFSNYSPDAGPTPPAGTQRRLASLRMDSRFALKADPEKGVQKGDFDLKKSIREGKYFNDWFHVCKEFVRFLDVCSSDEIPKPFQVREEVQEIIDTREPGTKDEAENWWLRVFAPVDISEALTCKEVRTIAAGELNVKPHRATAVLREIGFLMDNIYGKRYAKFRFPGSDVARPVGARRVGAAQVRCLLLRMVMECC
jgi:hypothetical protein